MLFPLLVYPLTIQNSRQLTARTPAEFLEKTYRLQSATREQIEPFKTNFVKLLESIDEKESEENVKGHLTDFLKAVY